MTTLSSRDQYVDSLLANIERYGVALVGVLADVERGRPVAGFTYTVGLTTLGHPELITYGLRPELAATVLNVLAREIRLGAQFRAGDRVSQAGSDGPSFTAIKVLDDDDVVMVREIYGLSDHVLQLVWPDGDGRLPWADGYTLARHRQPVRGLRPVRPGRRIVLPAVN